MAFPGYVSGSPGWEKVTTTTKKHKLGTPMFVAPNRWFCYGLAGEAITAGRVCEGIAAKAALSEDLVPVTAGAVGATTINIQLATTAVTLDEYADGFAIFPNVEEEGHQYLIKGHPAGDSTASLAVLLDEEAGLVTAITTSQEVGLVHNPFSNFLIRNTTMLGYPIGVSVVDIASASYGWLQVSGPSLVLIDASAPGKGVEIGASLLTQGAVGIHEAGTTNAGTNSTAFIGYMGATDGVSTEYHQVHLHMGMA